MRNLLGHYAPDSFTVGYLKIPGSPEPPQEYVMTPLFTRRTKRARVNNVLFDLEMSRARGALKALVKAKQAKAIVAVYPSFHFLQVARDVAQELKIPWLAYWHDTVFEHLHDTPLAARAEKLQTQTFAEASSLMVMSEGMVDFYREKYGVPSTALEHSFPEAIPESLAAIPKVDELSREALWGGSIYHINDKALARVADALARIQLPLLLTTRATDEQLQSLGIGGPNTRITLFPERSDYITALQRRQFLILSLNWADETTIGEGELATIFPTKTVEYMVSGRPILLHCPEHYFLARYVRRHKCGLVVSSRAPGDLDAAIQELLKGGPEVDVLCANALEAARMFSIETISGKFRKHVEAVAGGAWGKKVNLA